MNDAAFDVKQQPGSDESPHHEQSERASAPVADQSNVLRMPHQQGGDKPSSDLSVSGDGHRGGRRDDPPPEPGPVMRAVRGFKALFFSDSRLSRAEQLQARVDALRERTQQYNDAQGELVGNVIRALLDKAQQALWRNRLELAWRLVGEAEREELKLLDKDALLARAIAIGEDAKTSLPPEAAVLITSLVGRVQGTNDKQDASGSSESRREFVSEAISSYESCIIKLYIRGRRISGRVLILTVVLVALVYSLFVKLSNSQQEFLNSQIPTRTPLISQIFTDNAFSGAMSLEFLWCAALLGAIGACMSALLSFTYQGRAPREFEGVVVTLARPVIGATSGLIVMFSAFSGLLDFKSAAMLAMLAFLAGFSERFVIGTTEKLEGRAPVEPQTTGGRTL